MHSSYGICAPYDSRVMVSRFSLMVESSEDQMCSRLWCDSTASDQCTQICRDNILYANVNTRRWFWVLSACCGICILQRHRITTSVDSSPEPLVMCICRLLEQALLELGVLRSLAWRGMASKASRKL